MVSINVCCSCNRTKNSYVGRKRQMNAIVRGLNPYFLSCALGYVEFPETAAVVDVDRAFKERNVVNDGCHVHEGRAVAERLAERVGNEECVYGESGDLSLVVLIERNAHDEGGARRT